MLVYDGDCAFCTSCARLLERIGPEAEIVAWQLTDLAELGITEEQAADAVQWVEIDGTVRSGHEAIAAVLGSAGGNLDGRRPRCSSLPGISWLAGEGLPAGRGQPLPAAGRHARLRASPRSLRTPPAAGRSHSALRSVRAAADEIGVTTANEHVFSHGMRDTRETLELWSDRPARVLGGWAALSVAIALTLLAAVWVVAGLLTPDITPIHMPGLTEPSEPGDLLPILWRNSLVLALHATACVAGFIAGASMPIAAAQRTGLSRWIHVKAGELAILFVCAVTLFSLSTQALYLGFQGSTIAYQLRHLPRRPDPQRPPARAARADARSSCRSPPG